MDTLVEYYSQRAPEYEEIYQRDDPVRKEELECIRQAVRQTFAGRRVLEVACGTGFWTRVVVEVAESVVATDASEAMLNLARTNIDARPSLRFQQADAYDLSNVDGNFDAGLANFWLSHVPQTRLGAFLRQFHGRIGPGAIVLMADNMNVSGIGGELVRPPGFEDTYKVRKLKDGSVHQIVKNYYDADQLRKMFTPYSSDVDINCGKAYWWVRYRVR